MQHKSVLTLCTRVSLSQCSTVTTCAGTTQLHVDLERMVAEFVGQEDAITFGMGFATNSVIIPALVGAECLVISDSLNHASIVTGVRGSGAKVKVILHQFASPCIPFAPAACLNQSSLQAQVYNQHGGIQSDRQKQNILQQLSSLHAELVLIIIKRLKQCLGSCTGLDCSVFCAGDAISILTLSGSVQTEPTAYMLMQVFRHNDVVHLESVLQEGIAYGQPRTRKPWKKVLIIIEGIYSMEGEMCPLPQVVAIKKKYKVLLLTPLTVRDSFVGLNQGLVVIQVKHIMAQFAYARLCSALWAQHSQMGFQHMHHWDEQITLQARLPADHTAYNKHAYQGH